MLRLSLLLIVAIVACDDDFPRPSHIDGLRVLAIRAEPPEVAPGGATAITALVVAPGGLPADASLHWRSCILPLPSLAGGGFDGFAVPTGTLDASEDGPRDCSEAIAIQAAYAQDLGNQADAVLTAPAELFDDDRALMAAYALAEPPSQALRSELVAVAGVPLRVELTVRLPSGQTLVATKSVRVMQREAGVVANINPPAPKIALTVDGEITATSATSNGCLGRLAPPLRGQEVVVAALDLPETATRYAVLLPGSTNGAAVTRVERSELWSYSLFSTRGRFALDAIESEPRPATTTWRLDTAPAAIDLWVVLRDGRGGTSWCHQTL